MANGWGQYAQYLEALAKKKNPQYQPVTPVTQADMGEAVDAPEPVPFSAPLLAPRGPVPFQAPLLAPQGAERGPAGVASLAMPQKRGPAASPSLPPTLEGRASQDDLEALRKLFAVQQEGAEKLRGQADSIENAPVKDDLSPFMALADAWGNQGTTKLSSLYDKPMKKEERALMAAKLRNIADDNTQGVTKDRIQMLLGGDKNDIAALKNLVASQMRGVASDEKEGKEFSKQEKVMREALFFQGRTAPEIRNSIGKLQRATQAIALMDSIPDGNPTPGEMSNIATAMAGLATNSNIITNEKLKEILPSNVKLSTAGIAQWISSNPHGAEQTKWMNRFRREIDQETRVARQTLVGYQQDQADAMQGLTRPDRHKQIFDAAQNFINSRYYNPDTKKAVTQAVGAPPPKADWDPEKVKRYEAYMATQGGK